MKMRLLTSFLILISISVMLFATGVKTYVLDGSNWSGILTVNDRVRSQDVGNQSGDPPSPTTDPPSTPMVYVSIEYTDISAHMDMPGEWMFGGVQITTIASHTPIRLTFSTSGDLSNGSKTIPTYYQEYDGNNLSYVPNQPLHASVWRRASENWPTGMRCFSMNRGIGNNSFKLWIGLDVDNNTPKGRYTGWLEFNIVQTP